jgi:tetratricopeptide (TPR) repeat protein
LEALVAQQPLFELSEGLETPVQLIYLLTLLGFLVVGAYLVVRQVLIRRDLEESAKVLGERIRSGSEDSEDLFQLGVILLRKKLYTQACKNLEKAKKNWGGDPEELAQVHNALGFAYFNMQKTDIAIREYKQAVEKQPGYVTALNNLGDAYEKAKQFKEALDAYQEALNYAPNNKVASSRADALRARV